MNCQWFPSGQVGVITTHELDVAMYLGGITWSLIYVWKCWSNLGETLEGLVMGDLGSLNITLVCLVFHFRFTLLEAKDHHRRDGGGGVYQFKWQCNLAV